MPKNSTPPLSLDLHGDERSMVTKERDASRADEHRLFPSYSKNSAGGVPIKPGQTTLKSKKLQNFGGFRPVNTLSGRARDSGPVRAQGKSVNRGNKQPGFGTGSFYTDGISELESPERPNKRQRGDSTGAPFGGTINISDDDVMEQAAPENSSIAGHSARRSSASSQATGKGKRARKGNQVDEYREVERNVRIPRESPSKKHHRSPVDDERDERFTEDAARQRRLLTPNLFFKPAGIETPRKPKHEILQSVEIHGVNGDMGNTSSNHHSREAGPNRAADLRESPDELQGEATVRPAPTVLSRSAVRLSNDEPAAEEQPAPSRRQQLSPHDIRPTNFSSASSTNKKKPNKKFKPKKGLSVDKVFKVIYLRLEALELHVPEGNTKDLSFDLTNRSISFSGRANAPTSLSLDRVTKIEYSEDSSRKVRLCLTRTKGTGDQLDIELSAPEAKRDLCALLNNIGVKIVKRTDDHMNKAFTRSKRLSDQQSPESGPMSDSGARKEPSEPVIKPTVPKRMKLSDGLQDEGGNTAKQTLAETASSPRHNSTTQEVECTSSNPLPTEVTESLVHNKFKSFFSPPIRATRSMSRRAPPPTVVCDDEDEELVPQTKSKEIQKRWHRPLIYPRFGKKKAEVDAQDVERLSDNEFLNDNLIGFYIRFLQDHLERCSKDVAKRVYFFNSYFFATLTNSPKGKRAINYEGVQKWTRNVDIFSHDYVVVPINENAHWYVAIICNLPYLPGISEGIGEQNKLLGDEEPPSQPNIEVQEIQGTPETGDANKAQLGKEEMARQSLASMSLSDEEGSHEPGSRAPTEPESTQANPEAQAQAQASQDGESKGTVPGSTGSPRKSRKQKKKPTGPKHDSHQPIVITFDSLNLARSPTISILRDYLHAEAKSKRDVDIDKSMIKGMRAKEIPLQSNYSDCGLYLLAYLEKFVQNPDLFVWKLLRREMSTEEDWPEVKSGLLRSRLRKFLNQLYDEQAQLSPDTSSEQKIMADMQPISYLLTSPGSFWQYSSTEKLPENKGPHNGDPVSENPSGSSNPEPQSNIQQSSTTPEKFPSAAPPPGWAKRCKRSEKVEEVIEVPDSQEPIETSPASPLRRTTRQKDKEHQTQSDEPEVIDVNPEKQVDCQNEGDGRAEKPADTDSPDKEKSFEVEIQVKRTPPPSTTGESAKNSPRPGKRKHKPTKTT